MENKNEIDLLDILIILAKRKWFIFWVTLIVSLGAVVYSLLTPEIWSATATVRLSSSSSPGYSLGSGLLSSLGSGLLPSIDSSIEQAIQTITSNTFSMEIIDRFNLIDYFDLSFKDKLKAKDKSLDLLKNDVLEIGVNEEANSISISIFTKDKILSAQIANYYCDLLDRYNRENINSKGRQERLFLETRIKEIKNELERISELIVAFQEDHNTLDIGSQLLQSLQLYTNLNIEKQKLLIDLEIDKNFNKSEQSIKMIEKKISIVNNQIKTIEDSDSTLSNYILNLDTVPKLAREFLEYEVQMQTQQKLYEYLIPQYELAKVQEIKDLPTITFVDKAQPMGFRSKPKRAMICIISFFTAFFLSSFVIVFLHLLEPHKGKISLLYKEFFSKK
ncbi:MAG: Wzz/FepE/Etk N-terminal domain-containing protein [Candidatus Cloacimonetes bacterium]|nr:Wzz/FepE/Etk N-terminal domain-containing protein [Candidatus Cloacimonadota bacterium]